MQARLKPETDAERERARAMGLDVDAKLTLDDMVKGDVVFAASGVTHGSMFDAVHFEGPTARVHSLVWDSFSGRKSRVHSERRGG